jgi:hypothetical protein
LIFCSSGDEKRRGDYIEGRRLIAGVSGFGGGPIERGALFFLSRCMYVCVHLLDQVVKSGVLLVVFFFWF